MSDSPTIQTAMEEQSPPYDDGVETEIVAEEEFVFEGESVERETRLAILEDGGVHITQKTNHGTFDSLTLNGRVARRLVREVEEDDE